MILVILLIFALYLLLIRERYSTTDPFLDGIKDRFIDPQNHRYINQIDYYRDAPNINLESAINNVAVSSADINWASLNDYEYSQMVGLVQGNFNNTRIKNINAN
jgi:hypothetical protein